MYRITNSACHKTGEILYAVEEYYPEEKSWGIVKVFTSKAKAEEYRQTLEAYGKNGEVKAKLVDAPKPDKK